MFKTLAYIGKKLNDLDILWGVGGSILLNQFELIDIPHDIDIIVDIKDISRADEFLKSMGEKKQWEKTHRYSTRYFYEYVINGFDVDVMAGFKVNHRNGVFEYSFDNHSISEYKEINGIDIPFTSLEDWYVIYQLIPNGEKKADKIESYILSRGMKNSALLERALEKDLPIEVKERVKLLLRS
ncbi:MAG: hypothetical protein AB2421_04685 [Thermotaleaceae bacterium]